MNFLFPDGSAVRILAHHGQIVVAGVFFYVTARFPGNIWIKTALVAFQRDREYAFFYVRGVHRDRSHGDEVQGDAHGEHRTRQWKRIEKVPREREDRDQHGESTYQQPTVDQREILDVVVLADEYFFHGVVEGVFQCEVIPFVDFYLFVVGRVRVVFAHFVSKSTHETPADS